MGDRGVADGVTITAQLSGKPVPGQCPVPRHHPPGRRPRRWKQPRHIRPVPHRERDGGPVPAAAASPLPLAGPGHDAARPAPRPGCRRRPRPSSPPPIGGRAYRRPGLLPQGRDGRPAERGPSSREHSFTATSSANAGPPATTRPITSASAAATLAARLGVVPATSAAHDSPPHRRLRPAVSQQHQRRNDLNAVHAQRERVRLPPGLPMRHRQRPHVAVTDSPATPARPTTVTPAAARITPSAHRDRAPAASRAWSGEVPGGSLGHRPRP